MDCPCCGGDGKETCWNPDHGFINAVGGELSRLGCPGCGHSRDHKVPDGGACEMCNGTGIVGITIGKKFCDENGMSYLKQVIQESDVDKMNLSIEEQFPKSETLDKLELSEANNMLDAAKAEMDNALDTYRKLQRELSIAATNVYIVNQKVKLLEERQNSFSNSMYTFKVKTDSGHALMYITSDSNAQQMPFGNLSNDV